MTIHGLEVWVVEHGAAWADRAFGGEWLAAALHAPVEGPIPVGTARRTPCRARVGRLSVRLRCDEPDDALRRLVIGRPGGVYWAELSDFASFREVFDRAHGVCRLPPPRAWMFCNRRKAVRVRVDREMAVSRPVGSAVLVDLSATGGRMASGAPCPVGAVVRCRLPLPGEPSVEGQVVWVQRDGKGWVAGLRWVSLPQHVDQAIMRFVFQRQMELRRGGAGDRGRP